MLSCFKDSPRFLAWNAQTKGPVLRLSSETRWRMLMKGGNDFSQIVLANPTLGPLLLVSYQIIGVLIGVKLPSAIISKTFSTISGTCCLQGMRASMLAGA